MKQTYSPSYLVFLHFLLKKNIQLFPFYNLLFFFYVPWPITAQSIMGLHICLSFVDHSIFSIFLYLLIPVLLNIYISSLVSLCGVFLCYSCLCPLNANVSKLSFLVQIRMRILFLFAFFCKTPRLLTCYDHDILSILVQKLISLASRHFSICKWRDQHPLSYRSIHITQHLSSLFK